jgi:ribosomal protein L22
VSFKNTRETAQAINGWKLQRAQTFLENVIEKKEAVPMRRYCGSIGRTAQGTIRNYEPSFEATVWDGYGTLELRQRSDLRLGEELEEIGMALKNGADC